MSIKNKVLLFLILVFILNSYLVFAGLDQACGTCPSDCHATGDDCSDPCGHGCTEKCNCIRCSCPDPCTKQKYYLDNDGDTFGNPLVSTSVCPENKPSNYVSDNTDCNDNDKTVCPTCPELCDGKDNQCTMIPIISSTVTFIDEGCCGNGVVDANIGEECDYSFTRVISSCEYGLKSCSYCSSLCKNISLTGTWCGDEIIQDNEECDPPTITDLDSVYECAYGEESCSYCNLNCESISVIGEWCGDNILQDYEECESDGDGTSITNQWVCNKCLWEKGYCGDNVFVEEYEECESNEDCPESHVCNSCSCTYKPSCGNGIVDSDEGEVCDKGEENGIACNTDYNLNCTYCDFACNEITLIGDYCGDKIIQTEHEQCDDGNFVNKDGCDNCIIENKFYLDLDSDGFGDMTMFSLSTKQTLISYVTNNLDCNDLNRNLFPNNTEVCDNLDNDCNGIIDDILDSNKPLCSEINTEIKNMGVCHGLLSECDSESKEFICKYPEDFANIENNDYCDNLDNDCDGEIDEVCECLPKEEKICGNDIGECKKGIQICQKNGVWGDCQLSYKPIPEICDNKDNDCDGKIDENIIEECFVDKCPGTSVCVNGVFSKCEAECSDIEEIELNITSNDLDILSRYVNLSDDETENLIENSKKIKQEVEYQYQSGSTRLKNKISTNDSIKDISYTLFIPKCLANHVNEIDFENKDYTIIEDDPIIAWQFSDTGQDFDIGYTIKGKISEQCLEQIKGLPVADLIDLGEKTSIFKKFVLPLILIALAIGVLSILQKPQSTQEPNQTNQKPKTEQDYINEFIEKKRQEYLDQIKNMRFSSAEQAQEYMKEIGLSKEDIQWILQRVNF